MTDMTTVVLPGMDGTGRLLQRFRDAAPASHSVDVVALPQEIVTGFADLAERVVTRFPDERLLLVAESFSGPVAVNVAARFPDRIVGLVLVATFVDSPVPAGARFIPWRWLFRLPLPAAVARFALVGPSATLAQIRELRGAIRDVPAGLLADRVHRLIALDERETVRQCRCPLLYLRPNVDRLVPERCVNTLQQLRPDTICVEIDGPHLILQQNPAAAWQAIAEFTEAIA